MTCRARMHQVNSPGIVFSITTSHGERLQFAAFQAAKEFSGLDKQDEKRLGWYNFNHIYRIVG